ncbi:MAG: ComEC/Rec2 family competence protein [Anaerolineae bacterium]|nr:ComEC/Rec2 family competence protein [Anaerolineae bacterium]
MALIALSTAWLIGIYAGSRMGASLAPWGLCALLALGAACLWRQAPHVRWAAVSVLLLALGAMRYLVAAPWLDERSVSTYNGRGWVTLTGVVAAEPDVRDTYANLRLEAERLSLGEGVPVRVEGAVLVRVPRYPTYAYGDRLRVQGLLRTPPDLAGFSYRDYLAHRGVYSLLSGTQVVVLAHGQGSPLYAALLAVKGRAQHTVAQILPEPAAALLSGILLGVDTGLPRDLVADFDATGTAHIIAISGFNFAIVGGLLTRISVRVVGRRYAAWFSTAAIALYAVFVGGSGAVMRAAVMSCIAVWGEHLGRQNSSANALFATALLMTAWNPHLLWDLGFVLSFAATLGLVTLADPLGRRFEAALALFLPGRWAAPVARILNEPVVLTTCAQLTTLPIVVYHFGTLSLVTMLSNALVLPAQQQVMLWGGLATVAGMAWLPMGRLLGWAAWLFLAWTIWVVEWTAQLPHAAVTVSDVHAAHVWAWYGLLGGGVWWMGASVARRHAVWARTKAALRVVWQRAALLGAMGVAAALVWLAALQMPDGRLHVTYLDVGAGDAVLVETPSGRQVIVDGGPSATAMVAHLGRRLPFADRSVDLAVLTELTDQRMVGLVPIVERYKVSYLWTPAADAEPTATYAALIDAAQAQGTPVVAPVAGTVAALGDGVSIRVLHPAADDTPGQPVVLRIDYGRTCFLFAAGAEMATEAAMQARGEDLRCDVLQVAAHGREGATTPRFLEAAQPALGVISWGKGGRGDGPDPAVMARLVGCGATVARTDERGSIEVISDGVRYEVRARK